MADANYVRFSKRLRDIETRHGNMANGYVRLEERGGLLVPVKRVRTRRSFPARGLVLSLGLFLLFKGFLLSHLGAITYVDRVSKLEEGNVVEQMGAWAMRADPVTLWIAEQVDTLL